MKARESVDTDNVGALCVDLGDNGTGDHLHVLVGQGPLDGDLAVLVGEGGRGEADKGDKSEDVGELHLEVGFWGVLKVVERVCY